MGQRFRPRLLRDLGPEVLAAASDNDPTNVGTAAAVGAQSGYQLCWVALLAAPLLAVIMAIAAQGAVAVDAVAGQGCGKFDNRHHARDPQRTVTRFRPY